MTGKYDLIPDLALLLDAALRAGWSALPYVDRLTEGLGLEPSGGPEAAEKVLRKALGLDAAPVSSVQTTLGIGTPTHLLACGCWFSDRTAPTAGEAWDCREHGPTAVVMSVTLGAAAGQAAP